MSRINRIQQWYKRKQKALYEMYLAHLVSDFKNANLATAQKTQ